MGATLTYGSVTKWMELALLAEREWKLWQGRYPADWLDSETGIMAFMKHVTEHAKAELGFNLIIGARRHEIPNLMRLVTKSDKAYDVAMNTDWVKVVGVHAKRPEFYYVRWRQDTTQPWAYLQFNDSIKLYDGKVERVKDVFTHAYYFTKTVVFNTWEKSTAKRAREFLLRLHPDIVAQVTGQPPEGE